MTSQSLTVSKGNNSTPVSTQTSSTIMVTTSAEFNPAEFNPGEFNTTSFTAGEINGPPFALSIGSKSFSIAKSSEGS